MSKKGTTFIDMKLLVKQLLEMMNLTNQKSPGKRDTSDVKENCKRLPEVE